MRDKVCEAMNRIATSKDITDNHLRNVKQVNPLFDKLHQIAIRATERRDVDKNSSQMYKILIWLSYSQN